MDNLGQRADHYNDIPWFEDKLKDKSAEIAPVIIVQDGSLFSTGCNCLICNDILLSTFEVVFDFTQCDESTIKRCNDKFELDQYIDDTDCD